MTPATVRPTIEQDADHGLHPRVRRAQDAALSDWIVRIGPCQPWLVSRTRADLQGAHDGRHRRSRPGPLHFCVSNHPSGTQPVPWRPEHSVPLPLVRTIWIAWPGRCRIAPPGPCGPSTPAAGLGRPHPDDAPGPHCAETPVAAWPAPGQITCPRRGHRAPSAAHPA